MSNSKRVRFPPGEQCKFIVQISNALGLVTNSQIAEFMECHPRTASDWRREKYLMPLKVVERACRELQLGFPDQAEIENKYWHTSLGGRIGGQKVMEKYGRLPINEKARLASWRRWWNAKGKLSPSPIFVRKMIKKPRRSAALAEFFGILIGDGGVQKRQVSVTLDAESDKDFSRHVAKQFEDLFGLSASCNMRADSRALNIVASSTSLVECLVSLGIKQGNKLKQGLDIPDWIKANHRFSIACARGLFDTDGCFFAEVHTIRGRKYVYPRLNLTSASPRLIDSVHDILRKMNLDGRIRRRHRAVQLETYADICQYFKVVGTNNPKHLSRFVKFRDGTGRVAELG